MYKRKIEDVLTKWKDTPNHKPLVIKGVRQCGKTSSVLDFARKNYKNVVYMDFHRQEALTELFSGSLETDYLTLLISSAIPGTRFEPGKTCIVPVGFEMIVDMYPMDFEEWLWANEMPAGVFDLLRQHLQQETPVPQAIHNRMRDLLLQNIVVGGMGNSWKFALSYLQNTSENMFFNMFSLLFYPFLSLFARKIWKYQIFLVSLHP